MAPIALAEAILKIRTRIKQIEARGEGLGEQNTKATLIEPLLSALGWDVEEIEEVRREYRSKRQDNPVDYALFIQGSPRLFIEAKDLNATLDDRKWISQTVGYATVAGVTWCVLTNGNEYRLYNAHAPVDVEEKLFRTVRMADDSPQERTCETLELLSQDLVRNNAIDPLWKEHFVDRRVKSVVTCLLDTQDKSLVRLVRARAPKLTPGDIRDSLRRARVDISFATPIAANASVAVAIESTPPVSSVKATAKSLTVYGVELSNLIQFGVLVPPLELEAQYHRTRLTATVQPDGTVLFDGHSYPSLSRAAGCARNAIIGPPQDGRPWYQTNGWTFWRFRDTATGKLVSMDEMRKRYLRETDRQA